MICKTLITKTLLLALCFMPMHIMSESPEPSPNAEDLDNTFKGLFDGFSEDDWASLFKEVEQEIAAEQIIKDAQKTGAEPLSLVKPQQSYTPPLSSGLPDDKKTIITEPEPTFRDTESLFLSPSTITIKEKGKTDLVSPTEEAFKAFVVVKTSIIDAINEIEHRMMGSAISPLDREQYLSNQQPDSDKLIVALELIESKKVYTRLLLTPPSSNKKLCDDMLQLRKTLINTMKTVTECAAKLPRIENEEGSEDDKEDLLRALAGETESKPSLSVDTGISPTDVTPVQASLSSALTDLNKTLADSDTNEIKKAELTTSPEIAATRPIASFATITKTLASAFKEITSATDNVTKMIASSDVTKAFDDRKKERERIAKEAEKSGGKSSWGSGGFGKGSSGSGSRSSWGGGGFGGGHSSFGGSHAPWGSSYGSGSSGVRSSFGSGDSWADRHSSFGDDRKNSSTPSSDTKKDESRSYGSGGSAQPEKEPSGPYVTAAKAAETATKYLQGEFSRGLDKIGQTRANKKKVHKDIFQEATNLLAAIKEPNENDEIKAEDARYKPRFLEAQRKLNETLKGLLTKTLNKGITLSHPNPAATDLLDVYFGGAIDAKEFERAVEHRGEQLFREWEAHAHKVRYSGANKIAIENVQKVYDRLAGDHTTKTGHADYTAALAGNPKPVLYKNVTDALPMLTKIKDLLPSSVKKIDDTLGELAKQEQALK